MHDGPHRIFADSEGCLLLACHRADIKAGNVGEPLLGHGWGPDADVSVVVPSTLVPWMQDKRIVSVASGNRYCLALGARVNPHRRWNVFHERGDR